MANASISERVRRNLTEAGVPGHGLVVAVSGGADSTALLRILLDLRTEPVLRLHAAHLDHALRGGESTADAEWIARLCGACGVPATIARREIAGLAAPGEGIEEAARRVRYAFLRETAARHGCRFVAAAHTADDQAETVLHHVLRGTGLPGLRGMPRTRELGEGIVLVRPLLDVRRAELVAWLAEIGQEFRDDTSNRDERFTRNRIRTSLLPLLERDFNPQVRDSLLRLAEHAEAAQSAIDEACAALLRVAVRVEAGEACRVDVPFVAGLASAARRALFVRLWTERGWPRQGMTFAHWERLSELCGESPSTAACDLPGGVRAERHGASLVLRRAHGPGG